jgi:predicted AAA+ superfamily ATPase
MECMNYRPRRVEASIRHAIDRGRSVLLLGPRQTGKTTLAGRLSADLTVSFVLPEVRIRYEKAPSLLIGQVESLAVRAKRMPLVFLDEIQRAPQVLDVVQYLIDRKQAKFILTGSSARKLTRGPAVNLLPGRVVSIRLDPFLLREYPQKDLERLLNYGQLPAIALLDDDSDRQTDLESYVVTYLEQEVRAEAVVRNLGAFARFLEFAGAESGQLVSFRKLSQEIGVAHTTIAAYYQILEDCLIAERVNPLVESSTRTRLTRSPKYLIFDLGVRRLCAREGVPLPRESMGRLLEQFVGLELVRSARIGQKNADVLFWRDPDGPEVDWVIRKGGQYVPVEVKWTDSPAASDARHLLCFLREYPKARHGYIVCRTPERIQVNRQVEAIPWQETGTLVE